MNRKLWWVAAAVCGLAMAAGWAATARAQMAEVKEKPPMYTYVGYWDIPRAQWGEMTKNDAADQKILDKDVASGAIVGYGMDVNMVHQPDSGTHDEWWSAMSMAGLLHVLDEFYQTGNATTPVLTTATKHWDNILVSQYYNRHSGSWKNIYTHGSYYHLKPGVPLTAVDTLSKSMLVPLLEKLLADGTIHEYEIDTEAIHTEAPGAFYVFYLAADADALDKVTTALQDTLKSNPLDTPAFESMVDYSAHRDYLMRSNATYK
jgi:hypothetical protein